MTTAHRLGCWLVILLLTYLGGCTESPPPTQSDAASAPDAVGALDADAVAAPDSALPDGAMPVAYRSTLHHINVADLDGDGRQDLTLAAHVESRVETYYQQADRSFVGTGPLDRVGFHPNGTVSMAADDGERYLVLNAEAPNLLRTYRAQRGEAASFVSEVSSPAPKGSILLPWSAWGPTLAVAAKVGAEIRFYKGFDPREPDAAPVVTAMTSPKTFRRVEGLVAADLDGDGSPSALATVPFEDRLVAMDPAGADAVDTRDIWSFDRDAFVHVLLPVDFDGDGDDDLFVLGEKMPHATLLLSEGPGQFVERTFPIDSGGAQSGQVTVEADGSLMLWTAGEDAFVVWRWYEDRTRPPVRRVLERPGRDWIRFAAGDLDGDGHQDLVLGSSVGLVPVTAVYGPLAPELDGIGGWLAALKRRRETEHDLRRVPKETAIDLESAAGAEK